MTKKDYVTVAARFQAVVTANIGVMTPDKRALLVVLSRGLADDFAEDNDRFDRGRFLQACGV